MMEELLQDFLAESAENLARFEQEIVELERDPNNQELLRSLFRAMHTIKGSGGFLDLARMETVAHAAEDVLGLLRDGRLAVSPALIGDLLAAADRVRQILGEVEGGAGEQPGDDAPLLERLAAWCAAPAPEADAAPSRAAGAPATTPAPAPEPAPAQPPEAAPAHAPAPTPAAATGSALAPALADTTLRVDVAVLDRLMNLAGELVLARNRLAQVVEHQDAAAYRLPVQQLDRVTTELQEMVLRSRMRPVGAAWGKLPRLVRDLAQASGKLVDLELRGADTRLDRQILQAMQDPFTHMVRNAIDHGIETPTERRAAGKDERGRIILSAHHEGGQIVIEVADDGAGIDTDAIRWRAIERGLVRADEVAALPDARVIDLIFVPGFSTAHEVTNVSGRGVGMDVVRTNVERIGGRIEVESRPGEGTTIRVRLPLTLAILPAFIVESGTQCFALPQVAVLELVRLAPGEADRLEPLGDTFVYRLREQLLPLVRLADCLGLEPGAWAGATIAVCQVGATRFGLVVDRVHDTREIVVKPLGRLARDVPLFAGTTVLGDGRVLLILDAAAIAAAAGLGAAAPAPEPAAAGGDAGAADGALPLLLFDAGRESPCALPLAFVSRLEKVPPAAIERADRRWLVQHRGALVPLVPAGPTIDLGARAPRPVIFCADGREHFGLAVERIRDIVVDRLELEQRSAMPGVLGVARIAGRSTEIIDVEHFRGLACNDWLARPRPVACSWSTIPASSSTSPPRCCARSTSTSSPAATRCTRSSCCARASTSTWW